MTGPRDPAEFAASASGCETFGDCERKWAWRKIDKVPDLGNPYAQFGIRGHKILEDYHSRGVPIPTDCDEGQAAMAGLHLGPTAGSCDVEREFWIPIGGIVFHGFMDLSRPGEIYDHKFTGDFKYAKTPEQLREDIQASIYAYAVGLPAKARWIYYRRKRPFRAMPVDAVLDSGTVAPVLERAVSLGRRMLRIWSDPTITTALQLPPSVHSCEKYGGCQYKDRCNISPNERLQALMSNQAPNPHADPAAFLAAATAGFAQPGAVNPPPAQYAPPQGPPQQYAPPQGPPQYAPPQGPPQQYAPPQGPPQYAPPQGPPQYAPPQGPPQQYTANGSQGPQPVDPPKRGPGRPRKAAAPNADGSAANPAAEVVAQGLELLAEGIRQGWGS